MVSSQATIDHLDSTMSGCLDYLAFIPASGLVLAYDPLIEVARHTYGQCN